MIPSGIKTDNDSALTVKQVKPGLYSVENAYAGEYHFFSTNRNQVSQDKTQKSTTLDKSPENHQHNATSE